MASAKDIIIKTISRSVGDEFVKKYHYSGKVDTRTQLSLGAFYQDKLHGVLQFGPSINKKASILTVKNTGWNDFLELSRMAFDPVLPRNSESRCISVALKLLKKHAPNIDWVISYADATQCGDGAIYRASGFKLIGIKKNSSMWMMPDGEVCCSIIFNPGFQPGGKDKKAIQYGKVGMYSTWPASRFLKHIGAVPIPGFQIRYIYFLNKDKEKYLTKEILPFSKIDEIGAGMYRGQKVSVQERKSGANGVCSNPPAVQAGEDVQVDLSAPLNPKEVKNGRAS